MEQTIKKPFNIRDILSTNEYIIPIYQRNYSWEKSEISQLIKDIVEYFQDKDFNNTSYYLGSLVCFKRTDGKLELIDGQQRHTTLTLINLILKNSNFNADCISNLNLSFNSRKSSNYLLNELNSLPMVKNDESEKFVINSEFVTKLNTFQNLYNFKTAIACIIEEFHELVKNKKLYHFISNFYSNTKLFIVEVPEDTDLNHYFEIMNNRGEQLEKHEILKAELMDKISDDKKDIFAQIWDACSDMTNYVYFNFDEKTRKHINFSNLNSENSLLSITEKEGFTSAFIEEENTLISILKQEKTDNSFNQNEKIATEKYKSIIDFPNFLLQILKLLKADVSLDDKKLLTEFTRFEDLNSEIFIIKLLQSRILFDENIIKQDITDADENKRNWGIRKLHDKEKWELGKTFKNDDELKMLQTMLYYSNPSNSYNNWLFEVLVSLQINENYTVEKLNIKLNEIAKSRFDANKLSYPDIATYNFYYIDFILWGEYFYKVRGDEPKLFDGETEKILIKINKSKTLFSSFRFRQINSKEHLYPQSYSDISSYDLNSIGNLCLISSSQNSQGNKESPKNKKSRYEKDNSSLKRLIMFDSFDGDTWSTAQINNHGKEMLDLIAKI